LFVEKGNIEISSSLCLICSLKLLKYVNAKWVVRIPTFLVKGLYVVGKMMNNIFLKENATKLISDNIFPSDKIRQFIDMPNTLDSKSTNKHQQDE